MIKTVHFKNVKCLKDVTLDLEPLTVLVGPNGSGKTSILNALMGDLGELAYGDDVSWMEITQQIGGTSDTEKLRISGHFNDRHKNPFKGRYSSLVEGYGKHQIIDLNDSVKHPSESRWGDGSLYPDGRNIATFFSALSRDEKGEVETRLSDHGINGIMSSVDAGGRTHLVFDVVGRGWTRASDISTGVLRCMSFFLLRYQKNKPTAIMIEPPERDLHPYLMSPLMSIFRSLSEGKHRDPVQVVIATHSPELLENARPEEVRFLRLDDDGYTAIETIDTSDPGWAVAFDIHNNSLAEAWLSGGLGGVPGRRDGRMENDR